MVVDTGTVRLVIFIGMFLVFAGDYTKLVNKVFGNGMVSSNTTFGTLQGPSKHESQAKRISLLEGIKDFDSKNGR